MSVPVVAFLNSKGGVGKTSLVYHTAWMLADLGYRVVAADLDPQANLSLVCLGEERLSAIMNDGQSTTVYQALRPLQQGTGDVETPALETLGEGLALLCGDIGMYGFESALTDAWTSCHDGDRRALRVIGSISNLLRRAAEIHRADAVIADLGPSLGAINRAAIIATDSIVIPLQADILSVRGLRDLGTRLNIWRAEWAVRQKSFVADDIERPSGQMNSIGYVVTQIRQYSGRLHKSVHQWLDQIPHEFRTRILGRLSEACGNVDNDEFCLGIIRQYHSLMGMALEAHKPVFHLKPADGALGAHVAAGRDAYQAFQSLSLNIASKSGFAKLT